MKSGARTHAGRRPRARRDQAQRRLVQEESERKGRGEARRGEAGRGGAGRGADGGACAGRLARGTRCWFIHLRVPKVSVFFSELRKWRLHRIRPTPGLLERGSLGSRVFPLGRDTVPRYLSEKP